MRRSAIFWAAVIGLLAATLAVTLALGGEREPSRLQRPLGASDPAPRPTPSRSPAPRAPQVVMVRRRGGVSEPLVRRVRRADGVAAVTRVARGQALLRASRTAGGHVEVQRAGYAVPLDMLAVAPREYARMLPRDRRAAFTRLRPGTALLSRTSARLRRLGTGGTLTLSGGRRLRVVGVVDDGLVRAAELVVGRVEGARLGARRPYLLALADRPRALARALDDRRGADRTVAAVLGTAPWPVVTGIARPALLKVRFGEFAVRLPYGEDWISIDPAWVRRSIVTGEVPILGSVTCHRRMLPRLRGALAELRRRGLSRLVDRGDFAGCHAPRRIPGSGSPSLHAWGLAVDLNAGANPQFAPPRQDPRLVRIFERAGFTWGGRWPAAPDGMHFELQGEVTDRPIGRRADTRGRGS